MQQPNDRTNAPDDEIQIISNSVKPVTRISKISGGNTYICEIRTRSNERFTGILLKDTKPQKISKSTQTSEKDSVEHSTVSTQTKTETRKRTKPLEEFKKPATPIQEVQPSTIGKGKRKKM